MVKQHPHAHQLEGFDGLPILGPAPPGELEVSLSRFFERPNLNPSNALSVILDKRQLDQTHVLREFLLVR